VPSGAALFWVAHPRQVVVHSPVADSFVVAHILVEDSLVEGIPAGDNFVVAHTPAEDILDTLHLGADNPAVVHTLVEDNFVVGHTLAGDSFAAAFRLAADSFVAAADSSFGFVRAAAVLLPVVRNTCKTALRPATAGNNSYST
jgi:hypothetical protein